MLTVELRKKEREETQQPVLGYDREERIDKEGSWAVLRDPSAI